MGSHTAHPCLGQQAQHFLSDPPAPCHKLGSLTASRRSCVAEVCIPLSGAEAGGGATAGRSSACLRPPPNEQLGEGLAKGRLLFLVTRKGGEGHHGQRMCYVYLNMLTSRRLFGSQQTVGCTCLGELPVRRHCRAQFI